MTANLSRNATAGSPFERAPLSGGGWRALGGLAAVHRQAILDYAKVFAGSGGRLALQVVYFLALANTLDLHDMGVFASVSAAGMMLGSFSGFGFQAYLFRSGAARPSSLGGFFGAYYACFAASLPLTFGLAWALYLFLFADSLSALAYFGIIFAEVVSWRLIEMLLQVNNGLGRYGAATNVILVSSALRAGAAAVFMATGGGSAEVWSAYYFLSNGLAVIALAALYHPRVRPRWRGRLARARLLDGFYYAFSYLAFLAQTEIDKLIVLWLAGGRTAGVYAIVMRIADLTAAPLRPLFVLYSRKLLKAGAVTAEALRDILRMEGVVAAVSTFGLCGVIAILSVWPNALGHNVAAARGLLSVVLIAPTAKNLIEFHAELFFALDRMGLRSVFAYSMVLAKAGALALLLVVTKDSPYWGVWLNLVFALPCLLSFAGVKVLLRSERAAAARRAPPQG